MTKKIKYILKQRILLRDLETNMCKIKNHLKISWGTNYDVVVYWEDKNICVFNVLYMFNVRIMRFSKKFWVIYFFLIAKIGVRRKKYFIFGKANGRKYLKKEKIVNDQYNKFKFLKPQIID